MTNYFENLFSTGPTQVDKIPVEWVVLKSYMLPIISNNKKSSYLDIWKIVFTNAIIIKECRKVLDIFELFLICPFTNAKLERMFSHMNCIKTDWRSSLSRDQLDVLLCISKDGPSLEEFNPDASIDCWYAHKVRDLNTGRQIIFPPDVRNQVMVKKLLTLRYLHYQTLRTMKMMGM